MKTMLHKSFKPAKCKTSLRLATSRIKLMKNKKGVQINQMKKELAQLLETGQDRTARIRVEHVIREEKMVAAYELIEIYCELIVGRLPIIESQKMCPTDLKEAVTSVIFAAPRCSDISELSDIRKQFTAKYGKEFVSSAIELRPDCGVSRMLVEKLSAVAPDIKTKIKVLSDVAKEHNITWDPTSFEEKESKHPNDLLDGPANFETASTTNMDLPKVQASNIEVGHNHKEKQDAPVDFSQQNRRYTLGAQNPASTDTPGVETSSAATDADMRFSGITSERMERRQPVNNDFSSGRENWNMEFKDATSAAQAAAESAERAAMAARAAAQFSSHEKIAKQHPHVSDIRDGPSHVSAPPRDSKESFVDDRKPKNQQMGRSEAAESAERAAMAARAAAQFSSHEKIAKQHPHVSDIRDEPSHVSAPYLDSKESFVDDRKPKNQQMDQNEAAESAERAEQAAMAARAATQFSGHETVSSHHHPTGTGSHVYDGSLNDFHMADGYFDESLNEDRHPFSSKTTTHEGYEESKTNLGSGQRSNFESEDVNYFAEEAIKKQPSFSSSHSSTVSDELDVPDHRKSARKSVVGNPFAVVDQGNLFKEATKTTSNVSDEAVSDDDVGPRFDTGFEYDDVEASSSFLSPGRDSPPRSLGKAQVSSKSHLFSESLSFPEVEYVGPSETDDHIQANFDHSDGPDSESETEKGFHSRKNRIELNDLLERESSEKRPSSLLTGNGDQDSFDTLEDNNDSRDQSNDSDTTKELNFGTLTGGLRNKGGLKYPLYTKSTTGTSLSSKKSVEESSAPGVQTSLESSLDSRVSGIENKRPDVSMSSSDSDSDDYSDKHLVQPSKKASEQGIARSRFPPPAAFFDDDGSKSEEEVSKQALSRVRLGSGLSRRTRGASSAPYSKSHVQPEREPEPEPIISSFSKDKKPGPGRYTYSDEVPDDPRSYAGRFKEVSRRKTGESGSPKAQENPEPETIIPSSSKDKKPSRYSYSDEVPDEPRSYTGRFKEVSRRKTGEIGSPKAQENPKPKPEPKMTFSSSSKDKKPSRDSYSDEVPYEPRPYAGRFKVGSTKAQENPGSRSYSNDTPSEPRPHSVSSKQDAVETKIPTREPIPASESGTKASHVHPKLPDYDSIAARLEALRTNRQ